jgi:hypothetical protein
MDNSSHLVRQKQDEVASKTLAEWVQDVKVPSRTIANRILPIDSSTLVSRAILSTDIQPVRGGHRHITVWTFPKNSFDDIQPSFLAVSITIVVISGKV